MHDAVAAYAKKRDTVVELLSKKFEVQKPGGAFYVFPKAPDGVSGVRPMAIPPSVDPKP